jgi:hypothetical protein
MRSAALIVAAGLVLGFGSVSEAKVESMDGMNLGEHWFGPKRTMADLKGRVVMVEMWGFN